MSIAELAELIVSIATLITAVGAVIIGVRNSGKIQDVHLSLNSRLSALLESSNLAAHAAGREEERSRNLPHN